MSSERAKQEKPKRSVSLRLCVLRSNQAKAWGNVSSLNTRKNCIKCVMAQMDNHVVLWLWLLLQLYYHVIYIESLLQWIQEEQKPALIKNIDHYRYLGTRQSRSFSSSSSILSLAYMSHFLANHFYTRSSPSPCPIQSYRVSYSVSYSVSHSVFIHGPLLPLLPFNHTVYHTVYSYSASYSVFIRGPLLPLPPHFRPSSFRGRKFE